MKIYVGAVSPEAARATIAAGSSGMSFTTATSARFRVKRPDGSIVYWPAAITSQADKSITFVHPYDVGDLDVAGEYRVLPQILYPGGGQLNATVQKLTVTDPFA